MNFQNGIQYSQKAKTIANNDVIDAKTVKKVSAKLPILAKVDRTAEFPKALYSISGVGEFAESSAISSNWALAKVQAINKLVQAV